MKNTTTKLTAATLIIFALASSHSAMATNEDSGSYDVLNGKSQSVSELSLTMVSYRSGAEQNITGTSEGGYDSAYVGSTQSAPMVTINTSATADYLSMQNSLQYYLAHTNQ